MVPPKNPISLRDILSPTELASVASLISRINYMLQFNYGFARENPGLSEGCKVLENMMSGHRPPESPPTKPLCRNCFNSGIEQGVYRKFVCNHCDNGKLRLVPKK